MALTAAVNLRSVKLDRLRSSPVEKALDHPELAGLLIPWAIMA